MTFRLAAPLPNQTYGSLRYDRHGRAHGFEREFSRLEVHKRIKSQSTAASRRGVFRNPEAMDYAPLRRFLEGNLTRLRHDPCLKTRPWSLISNYVGTLGQTDLTRQANIPA
jgi:hypothetical protein